jgi:glycosyltransferase involved in cell wall biosynthesis
MKSSEVLVSVVLCTYNGSAFIREQLQSIMLQTYTQLEIIIVDDLSTDNTFKIIEEIAVQDNRIRLFRNSARLGYNKNYEKALQLARGHFISISDQDDIWREDKIELLIKALKANSCVMVYSHSQDFAGNLAFKNRSAYEGRIRYFEGTDARKLFLRNPLSGHSMLFYSSLLKTAFPFDENVFYDFWLAVIACSKGGIIFCSDTLVYRRRHEKNASLKYLGAELDKPNPYSFLVTMIKKAITAPGLPEYQKEYGRQLNILLSQSLKGRFNRQLFLFCVKNRSIVFYYKEPKLLSFFSHFKHSIRIANGNLFTSLNSL